jgi:hypothetical protein
MAKRKKTPHHGTCYCAAQRDAAGVTNMVCARSKKHVRRLASRLGRGYDKKHGRYGKVFRAVPTNC